MKFLDLLFCFVNYNALSKISYVLSEVNQQTNIFFMMKHHCVYCL